MVFAKRVKNYTVSSKYLKSVGEDVCNIGFPVGDVEKGNLTFEC